MADIQWEKDQVLPGKPIQARRSVRWKFLLVGAAILAVMAYLIYSTLLGARYFVTVENLLNDPDLHGKKVRVSGVVVGDPVFDPGTNTLTFVVANISNDDDTIKELGGPDSARHKAIEDPNASRMKVVAHEKEIPDLLTHGSQPIMSGKLVQQDGETVFLADKITLKCPTKYEEDVPDQVIE